MIQPVIENHVEVTPGVCGGKPRIAGHRIRVQDIAVWHEQLGLSADEIVSQNPQITLADVYASLAYYHDHSDEIRHHMEQAGELTEALRATLPSKLLRKLESDHADGDSVSPR